jgi:malate dehydrogenase
MVESIVKNKHRILPCAVWLEGEYGLHDTVVGVPIKIGSVGLEEIIQIKLLPEEEAALQKSAADVKENLAKVKF